LSDAYAEHLAAHCLTHAGCKLHEWAGDGALLSKQAACDKTRLNDVPTNKAGLVQAWTARWHAYMVGTDLQTAAIAVGEHQ